jgi:membrane fusion protein (multidrug efflux system)
MLRKELRISGRAVLLTAGLIGGLGAAGAGAYYWMDTARYVETTNNAYLKADETMIAPDVRGHVEKVAVKENQRVEKGEPLLRIEPGRYEARIAEAKGQVAALEAKLGTLKRRIDMQQAAIDSAAAGIEGAEAERDRAAQDRARYRDLADERAGSREQYEDAVAAHRKAVSSVKSAKAKLAAEKREREMLRSQLKETKAQLKKARAALETAKIDLEDTVVRAPFDGIVGDKSVERGQYLRPGQETFTLVPVRDLYVQANFKETQLEHMAVGQEVRLEVDAFPDTPITGRIQSFAPATGAEFALLPPKNATGNFTKVTQRVPVRISVPEDSELTGALRPGLSVVVSVDTRTGGERPDDGRGLADAALPGTGEAGDGTRHAGLSE